MISVEYDSGSECSIVVVDKLPTNYTPSQSSEYGYLWVPTHPEIGLVQIGTGANAQGCKTKSAQIATQAEGYNTLAAGKYAHVEGKDNIAVFAAHAEGESTKALAVRSHSEGLKTTTSGDVSHAEGANTVAGGNYSHAEGYGTKALGIRSHSEGANSQATGETSHAEGQSTTASGQASHSEGYSTTASGKYSHAEGYYTQATNTYAHTEGVNTKAKGEASHAGGRNTVAGYANQTVIGQFNANKPDTLYEVGNGTSSANKDRSNAFEVYIDGHAEVQTMGEDPNDNTVATKGYVDDNIKASISTWEKIADITTIEEVNGIVVTSDEFSDIAKCKEFIVRAVFPKSATGANISLGSVRLDFNNRGTIACYFSNVTIDATAIKELRCHTTIADSLVFSVGTQSAVGQAAVIGNAYTLVGDRYLNEDVEDINFYVNSNDLVFPTGTRLVIYGKKIEISESIETVAEV